MARRTAALLGLAFLLACAGPPAPRPLAPTAPAISAISAISAASAIPADTTALLEDLERRSFHFFWDLADPHTLLVPDRAPTPSFSSIAAVGFGLNAYGIGAERGYVTREAAAARTLATLRSLLTLRQGAAPHGVSGYKGFFYHFLDMRTGERFETIELSTIDTSLLMAGILFSQSYFDRALPTETAIRATAEELYDRVDWPWEQVRRPAISMGWTPEEGFHTYDWRGYNEAMIVLVLALGSPTHPVDPGAWGEYLKTARWGTFEGEEHLLFAPLFGHQYSHVWIDFRGIKDALMREKGIDYFENSRRATLSQHAFAIENPNGYRDYGDRIWGLTACDGPIDGTLTIDGRKRTFYGYAARGATAGEVQDDGTIAPTAAASSIVFTPELSIAAIREMRQRYGADLYGKYGFLDAFNPTLRTSQGVKTGHVDPNLGWFDVDYLGIDQGPIVAMVENYRSGLVWKTMRKNEHIVLGLQRAGFTGGWLEGR
ncbi:MAG TPA: glucoamylase family protein [Thermoanaerobaculia bacterium]|nr:glucoamylase family protein [Thermoanaerobaculia bacterium]